MSFLKVTNENKKVIQNIENMNNSSNKAIFKRLANPEQYFIRKYEKE